ncbi:uncharacterized protein K441DRAFT_251661 [Cenococcum geophilum 1.58]|uniref:uncharacterized protein n=1 Tax=Cenococcum geophilum 1.58 TaxID=794803 RepID=UPI00358E103E|nr:hypothetical protein K441DRAFT_251661 [Cenococcum geophilum 1.58]
MSTKTKMLHHSMVGLLMLIYLRSSISEHVQIHLCSKHCRLHLQPVPLPIALPYPGTLQSHPRHVLTHLNLPAIHFRAMVELLLLHLQLQPIA